MEHFEEAIKDYVDKVIKKENPTTTKFILKRKYRCVNIDLHTYWEKQNGKPEKTIRDIRSSDTTVL